MGTIEDLEKQLKAKRDALKGKTFVGRIVDGEEEVDELVYKLQSRTMQMKDRKSTKKLNGIDDKKT